MGISNFSVSHITKPSEVTGGNAGDYGTYMRQPNTHQ